MATNAPVIDLTSERPRVDIPRVVDIPWRSMGMKGQHGGPVFKILSIGRGGLTADPNLQSITMLTHIPPSWFDPELVHHPCVEEVFRLGGESPIYRRGPGWYLYRPPGILHGSWGFTTLQNFVGGTLLQRFAGPEVEDVLLRYDGDEFEHKNFQPVTDDYKHWPVEWVEDFDSNVVPWIDVEDGPWRGARYKRLSYNRVTGGGTVLLDLPPGWTGEGSRARGTIEEFVVEGQIAMDRQWFERWGYASRPAGEPAIDYHAPNGAQLCCFWDVDELSPS